MKNEDNEYHPLNSLKTNRRVIIAQETDQERVVKVIICTESRDIERDEVTSY